MAWTAAHSTKVLFTSSVPLPVRNRSRTKAWTHVGRVPQRAGPRRDAQAAGVGRELLRALERRPGSSRRGRGSGRRGSRGGGRSSGRSRPRRRRGASALPARCTRAAPRPTSTIQASSGVDPETPPTPANSVEPAAPPRPRRRTARAGRRPDARTPSSAQRDAHAAPAEAGSTACRAGWRWRLAVDLDDQPSRRVGGMEPRRRSPAAAVWKTASTSCRQRGSSRRLRRSACASSWKAARRARRDVVAAGLDLDARHRREQALALGRRQAGEVLEERTLGRRAPPRRASSTSRARSGWTRGTSRAGAPSIAACGRASVDASPVSRGSNVIARLRTPARRAPGPRTPAS